jgi:putative transposase
MISKILLWLQDCIKPWTKPAIFTLTSGLLSDISRSRLDLMVENAMLRQQWIVLNRQIKRPQLTNPDRFRLVILSHFTKFWNQCLPIVQPDTLLRWHRELFRIYWRRKSPDEPRVSPETISLIQKMARENSLWGAERIRGELLKLGFKVSKRSIQKYMLKERRSCSSSQSWATFLQNQASEIWACDFTVVGDWLFRPWYIFVLIELKTRRIVHTGVTRSPTDEWTAEQRREARSWGKGPKYLIHDRDCKDAALFSSVSAGTGIKELRTLRRAARANGVCERRMGSLRRECLDHILIDEGRHLERVVKEYAAYFNRERPHQGIGQRIPEQHELPRSKPTNGWIQSKTILGGRHHSYLRAIYLN